MSVLWDMHRFGPAPTWERELAAAAGNLIFTVLVAGVLAFVLERPLIGGIVGALFLGHIGVRLVIAARRARADRTGVPR